MMQMDGGDRLRVTLLDCMETGRSSLPGLTLEAILMADRNGASPQPLPSRNQSNRTLLDVQTGRSSLHCIHLAAPLSIRSSCPVRSLESQSSH
ncbi:hypothetical protein F2Q70_00030163 [Brassica cretica]|uniref:Uncharacterized protein n=1 Tax=Brassica cretica TaxID=69181 RepID=A0A8S9FGY9_BRACR|nr:hypothetical protein F2Q70_00030163 [Brassica cretica]